MQNNTISMPCPHCHITLQIPAEYIGQNGRCKHCQGEIVVYDPDAPIKPTKQCPHCKETVRKDATTCKHCGKQIVTQQQVKSCMIAFCIVMLLGFGGYKSCMSSFEESPGVAREKSQEQSFDIEKAFPNIPGMTHSTFTNRWNEFVQYYGYGNLALSSYWANTGSAAMLPFETKSQQVHRGGEITLQGTNDGISSGWIEWNALELFNVNRGQQIDPSASIEGGQQIAFSFGALAYALNTNFSLADIEPLMNRIMPVLSDWEKDFPPFRMGNFEYEAYFLRIDFIGIVLESHYKPN